MCWLCGSVWMLVVICIVIWEEVKKFRVRVVVMKDVFGKFLI